MKVSFIVIAYNAENTLDSLFENLTKQDYKHELIEIILVDSNSTDDTKQKMLEFKRLNSNFSRVDVFDNPKRILPCGWNIALKEATGDIILRVDAHTSIPNNFITNNVKCIKSGEKICGGKVTSILENNNKWQQTLIFAENSALGGGIATFRRSNEKKYVSTLAFAAYSREIFGKVGLYNEHLARTEDNEMHYRMKKAGYKFCLDPDIRSERFARNSLIKMIKQKYLNGYWIGLTLGISPRCFSIYHFVPLAFVISSFSAVVLGILGIKWILYILISAYLMINLILLCTAIMNAGLNLYTLTLPIIFFLIHFSYGIGTLVGIIRLPIWLKTLNRR